MEGNFHKIAALLIDFVLKIKYKKCEYIKNYKLNSYMKIVHLIFYI